MEWHVLKTWCHALAYVSLMEWHYWRRNIMLLHTCHSGVTHTGDVVFCSCIGVTCGVTRTRDVEWRVHETWSCTRLATRSSSFHSPLGLLSLVQIEDDSVGCLCLSIGLGIFDRGDKVLDA